jgi:hypothetical protein
VNYNVPPENAKAAIDAGYFYAPANVVKDELLKKEIEETPLTVCRIWIVAWCYFWYF